MGQILNADKPDQRVKDFRVLLLRGKRITAQTNSSPLGEFRFELADAKNWKLLFEVEGQEVIPISLGTDMTVGGNKPVTASQL